LTQKGISTCIYESKKIFGGLIACSKEEGNLFHRVGGHVFNTKNNLVRNWFWSHFNKEKDFIKANRNAVIYLNKEFINYPIELNLNQLNKDISSKVIEELLKLTCNKNKISQERKTFGNFLESNFGKTLYSIYFSPYNEKIWNRDLHQVPLDWLEGKLPMISPNEIIRKNIISSKEDGMVHSNFYYPREGGSQFIVNTLAKGLNIINEQVKLISHDKQGLRINNHSKYYNHIVFTGNVRDLFKVLDKNIINDLDIKNIIEEIKLLDSNGTTVVLCECNKNPYSWVYMPDRYIKAHRIIMTGNFSSRNTSTNIDHERSTCTVEFIGKIEEKEIKKELIKLPFQMKSIATNYSKDSYVIQNKDTRALIGKLTNLLKQKNISLCGRFAEWEYYNMDAAIESAMKLCATFDD
tara:strand:+ start:1389 stop:2612 length:1224 start_codon:yes stop_codon:yes gene_type:complete